jgi:hypothetical protein
MANSAFLNLEGLNAAVLQQKVLNGFKSMQLVTEGHERIITYMSQKCKQFS